YVTAEVGLPTLTDIVKELAKPGRDPREKFEAFSFAEGVNSMEDLRKGMKLSGIVTNITNFGAFVDIGVHQDGLVHTSQLANRFVANPNDVVKVSQVVEVTVVEVDIARKRISLSMKTEESPKADKSGSQKEQGTRSKEQGFMNKEQGAKNNEQRPKNFNQKPQQAKKEADGDLQEKLAKLKGMFK
ncbi:MAG: S1 RNA-binding domain-containing protein, partial [Pedobacter sp.]